MQTFWAGIFPILICRRPFSVIQSIQLWCQNNKFKASNQSTEKLDYFSGIGILCGLEQCVELANEKLFSSGQVVAGGDPQSQVGVLKNRRDVLNERFFINTNRQNLVRQKKSNQIKSVWTHKVHAYGLFKGHTCPLRLTPMMPEVGSCGAVTKTVSAEMRFM